MKYQNKQLTPNIYLLKRFFSVDTKSTEKQLIVKKLTKTQYKQPNKLTIYVNNNVSTTVNKYLEK